MTSTGTAIRRERAPQPSIRFAKFQWLGPRPQSWFEIGRALRLLSPDVATDGNRDQCVARWKSIFL